MAAEKKQINPEWAAAKPIVNGGASGMRSTMLIQPIDMIKVRIQLGEKGNPVSPPAIEASATPKACAGLAWLAM